MLRVADHDPGFMPEVASVLHYAVSNPMQYAACIQPAQLGWPGVVAGAVALK